LLKRASTPFSLARRSCGHRILGRHYDHLLTHKDKGMNLPDRTGHFGIYGGRYVSETLMPALLELTDAYNTVKRDRSFKKEFDYYLKQYGGRETPLFCAERFSRQLGGARIYLKREDLNHTGAHKINNTIGQILLARRMGKTRIIAETGAGQHGVATATVAALFGFACVIYMGEEDIKRQASNVLPHATAGGRCQACILGQQDPQRCHERGPARLDNQCAHDLLHNRLCRRSPSVSADGSRFQKVIGEETKKQLFAQEGRLPDYVVACVGGAAMPSAYSIPFSTVSR